ncbi:hypothetical protein KDM41_08335 [bacterium]|nr:hypothetical protein [bacterium]
MSKLASRLAPAVIALAAALPAAGAPPAVTNPATPRDGVVVAPLVEQWRAGGEDDDVFFGNIGAVRTDAEGNVLLLDSQLSEVHRISPTGDHLGVIGAEGDGPGEVRRPNDMFVTADGTVCLLQGFPGRVVMLHPDGTPAGETTYKQAADAQSQFAVMVRGLALPDGMVLAGIRMSFGGGGTSRQEYFLARCDGAALQRSELLMKEHTIDYSDFALDELGMDFVWSRIAVLPDGRVVVAPARNEMSFTVHAPDGTPQLTFGRPCPPRTRTADESAQARRIIEAVGANYPTPPRHITIEDTPPAVGGLWATADGRVWVQPGGHQTDLPDGTWVRLDVYGPDGVFRRQVALAGDHDATRDGLHILPDGRIVVVTGSLDAFLSQQAVAGDAEAAETAPLEVICYAPVP